MMAGCHLMMVADRETTPRRGAPHPPIRSFKLHCSLAVSAAPQAQADQ